MPNITPDELQILSGLLRDIDLTTAVIRERCENAKAQCDNVTKHTNAAYTILHDVNDRQ
jgi:hypothetical protein